MCRHCCWRDRMTRRETRVVPLLASAGHFQEGGAANDFCGTRLASSPAIGTGGTGYSKISSHAASSLRTASFCNSATRPKNKAYASDHSTPHFIARKTFTSPRTMYLLLFSFSFHLQYLFSSIYLCLLPSGQMFHVGFNYN